MNHNLPSSFTLNTGAQLPAVALGTWKVPADIAGRVVADGLAAGHRHFDCAPVYRNQDAVGAALAAAVASGVVERSSLFVTSKLFPRGIAPAEYETECRTTLASLQLEYVDLYLLHWPFTADGTMEEMWCAMERLLTLGLVRAIGVSNFSALKLRALAAHCKVLPAVNQVERHVGWRQDALVATCAELGVHVMAYSPLGSGDQWSAKESGGLGRKVPVVPPLQHAEMLAVARDTSRSPAQLALMWLLATGSSVCPKSTNVGRMRENVAVAGAEALAVDALARIGALEPQCRLQHGAFHTGPGKCFATLEDLWDEDTSYLEGRPFERPDGFRLLRDVVTGEEEPIAGVSSPAAEGVAAAAATEAQRAAMASTRAETLRRALATFFAKVALTPQERSEKVENLVARVVGGPPSCVGGMVLGGVLWSEAELFVKLSAKYGEAPPALPEASSGASPDDGAAASSAASVDDAVPLRFVPCGEAQLSSGGGAMIAATFDCATCPPGARVVINAHVGGGWVFCGTERHAEWDIWIGAYLSVSGAEVEMLEGDDGEQWSGDECVGRFAVTHDGVSAEIVVTYGTRAD